MKSKQEIERRTNKMVTENEFKAFEEVRLSGQTNMFDLSNVEALSGVDRETLKEIIKNYDKLKDEKNTS